MRRGAWIALCLLLAAGPVLAQEQRGAIEGVVKDVSGAVLPGVTVEARSPALVGVATSVSDSTGAYRFPALPPGEYDLRAELSGFTTFQIHVPLGLGQIKTIDMRLTLAGVSESVEVTAESPLVDVKQSAAFQNISGDLVDKLPRGRDFTSLVTIAPGANDEDKLAGISIDGASGAENQYVVDGINTTNIQTGRNGKSLVTDFVEEVQVKSSGYNAEFGGATGGVINVISKAGSNRYTGDLAAYYTGSNLAGPPRQTLRLNPSDDTIAEYITYPKDTRTQWEPGFTIGGPLLRDRLWFFGGYIPELRSTDRTVPFNVDSSTGTFNEDLKVQNATVNVQAQLSSALRAKFAMSASSEKTLGQLPPQDGTGNPSVPYGSLGNRKPNASYSGQLDFVANNRLYISGRGGIFRYNNIDSGYPNELWYRFQRSAIGFPGVPADLQRERGYSNLFSNFSSTKDLYTRIGADVDVTYYANFAGRHTFKGGLQFNRYGNNVLRGELQPRIDLYWGTGRNALDGRRNVRGEFGYYSYRQFQTTGDIHSNNIGLFIQDAWTIGDRLTVNMGIRSEKEKVPSYVAGNPGIDFGFGDKWAPRLGFAYDVKGDGQWKAYGSFGIFYDITKLEMPRGSFGGDKWIQYYYTLDTPNWDQIGVNGNWPGTLIETVDYRHPSNDPNNPTIDPNLKPVEQREFSIGLDHELTSTTSVGVRYVRKWLIRTIEDVGVIVPGVGEVYYIANPGFGVAKTTLPTECNGPCPDQPPATRNYNGIEFRLKRRMSKDFSVNLSYLYSRLYGNYSGLASSDENGRSSPNVNRFFDGLYNSFDQNAQPVFGRLATDRPHQFKVQGIYDFPFGTTIGVNYYVANGTPLTTQYSQQGIPFFPFGRGDLGRTPRFSKTDLYLQHELRFSDRLRLQLALNVLNLFDQKTPVSIDYTPYQNGFSMSDAAFFQGFDAQALAVSQGLEVDPRGGLWTAYQGPRQMRMSVKLMF